MTKTRFWVMGILACLLSLVVISLLIALFTSLGYLESFRIVFGSVYVLFLPGFILSYVFFPKTKEFDAKNGANEENDEQKGSIDWIERIALSFALSIAVVPLVVFYLNLVGVSINLLNSALTILGIIIISVVILVIKARRKSY